MTLHRLCGTIVLLASVTTPGTLGAQTIAGRVLDDLTEVPISTAAIMLLDSTDTAVERVESDSVGRFFIRAPGAGMYRLYANRLAYEEFLSETFSLGEVGSVELLLRMAPMPVELDPFVVTAEWQRVKLEEEGFYRRRDNTQGYFFDEEEIQKWRPTFITDLLRNVPGLAVQRGQLGEARVLSRRIYKRCPLKIVLDGFKVDTVGGDLDFLVDPNRVIGIEIYPGAGGMGAPVQHRGMDAFCGILMIWTR
jgi:Carboxypeptidase regulatory-like domain